MIFFNVVLEKDGEDQLDPSFEKFLNPMPPHVPYGLRGLPPGCG
jgi:hypothetical protein